MKELLRRIVPTAVRQAISKHTSNQIARELDGLPLAEKFDRIYRKGYWRGGTPNEMSSGSGSREPAVVTPYVEAIRSYLSGFPQPPSVTDLGVGDFHVGRQLVAYCSSYTGCDIAPSIIASNRKKYRAENLRFLVLDATQANAPPADILFIRQVLQHLSNRDIGEILRRLDGFTRVIITEHVPKGTFKANQDHVSGGGTRIERDSGVDVAEDPFHFPHKKSRILCEVEDPLSASTIVRTILYER